MQARPPRVMPKRPILNAIKNPFPMAVKQAPLLRNAEQGLPQPPVPGAIVQWNQGIGILHLIASEGQIHFGFTAFDPATGRLWVDRQTATPSPGGIWIAEDHWVRASLTGVKPADVGHRRWVAITELSNGSSPGVPPGGTPLPAPTHPGRNSIFGRLAARMMGRR